MFMMLMQRPVVLHMQSMKSINDLCIHVLSSSIKLLKQNRFYTCSQESSSINIRLVV